MLAICELNRVELLRDVFVWAYGRSSGRYSAVRQSLGQPDPFVEVVETELMSLHEGNIARYRLRLAEHQAWRQDWR